MYYYHHFSESLFFIWVLTLPWSENSTGYIGISEKWSSCQRVNGSAEWIMLAIMSALSQCGCQDTILILNGWKRLFDLVADWSNVILNDTEFTLAGHVCGATFNLLCPMLLMLFDCSIIRGLPGVNDSVVAITHTHNLPCTKSCQNLNNRSVGLGEDTLGECLIPLDLSGVNITGVVDIIFQVYLSLGSACLWLIFNRIIWHPLPRLHANLTLTFIDMTIRSTELQPSYPDLFWNRNC